MAYVSREKRQAILEALLFAMGDAVKIEDLAQAMEISAEEVEDAADALKKQYEADGRGLKIIRVDDAFQICTKEEFSDYLIKLVSKPKEYNLTDVMMETLAIIAYRQPLTRSDIEKIRGVSCEHGINSLLEFGLIEEKGRLQAPGRPILFGTTDNFLRAFGMESLDELPEPEDSPEEVREESGEENDEENA